MTRRVLAILLAATALAVPSAEAAPKPGKVLLERSGVVQRSWLRVTQDAFRIVNDCTGTQLNGTETNGLSAAVLDVSKYAGQHFSVTFADEIQLGGFYHVMFYSRDCQLLPGRGGAWQGSHIGKSLEGAVPSRAAWVVLARGNTTTHFGSLSSFFPPSGQLTWKVTIRALPRAAAPPPRARCRQIVDPKGDDSDPQLDVLSADVAVDTVAVTVGIRLASLDFNDLTSPQRAYLVEFTLPDRRTLFLGLSQGGLETQAVGDDLTSAFRPFGGTKDATGWTEAGLSTEATFAWLDTRTGELRVSAEFAPPKNGKSIAALGKFPRGARLTDVTVRVVDGPFYQPELRKERDSAKAAAPYVIGTPTCLQRVVD